MTELRSRPRFRFRTSLTPEAITERIRNRTRQINPAGIQLSGSGHHLVLQFPPHYQRSWTPQMDLDLEEVQSEGRSPATLVRCQIGPAPTIWMLFVGGYLALCVIALLGIAMGVSQQVVGAFAWGWWVALPTPFLALAFWLMSREGKRRAQDDMLDLKHFVDAALGCDCFALAEPDR